MNTRAHRDPSFISAPQLKVEFEMTLGEPDSETQLAAAEEPLLMLAEGEQARTLRRRTDEGADEFQGVFRVTIASGEDHAVLFLPFSPAFAGDPAVDCEQVAGPDADVRVAACFPHGARLEIRLLDVARKKANPRDAADDADVIVEVYAGHE